MCKIRAIILYLILMAGNNLAQDNTIAIIDLVAQGIKENEAILISEQLRSELIKYTKIKLIERNQMQEIFKEQGFQQSGCTNDTCAIEVGKLLDVKNLIIGFVGISGSYIVLSIRVINVSTGIIAVNSYIRTKGSIDKLFESSISEAASEIYMGLYPQDMKIAQVKGNKLSENYNKKAIIIIGGVSIFIGGGIAAAVLLNRNNGSSSDPIPNTRIYLP